MHTVKTEARKLELDSWKPESQRIKNPEMDYCLTLIIRACQIVSCRKAANAVSSLKWLAHKHVIGAIGTYQVILSQFLPAFIWC
jgi:ribosomal protein L31E